MARSINEQMDFLEPLPRNLITGDAELTEPLPNPDAPEYEQMRKAFSKDVGKGIITSPVTGAADTVEAGKMLPELDDKVKPFAPTYTGIEAAFEKLYNLGINRKTAEKAIKDVTGIKLEGTAGEFTGELVGLPAVAATKAVNAIASSAVKYGSTEAPKAISRISAEAKKLFSDAGGFDDLATATAGSTRGQTRKMLDKRSLPDTSITKIIIGQSGKDYDKKVASYNKAKQQLIPGKNRVDDQDAQELWNRTGAQEDVVDNDIVYEVPTAKARLKLKESDIFDYKEGRASFDPKNEVTLKDILDFDELYKQAPYLKNVQVKRLNGFQRLQGTKAAYNPESNTIFIASGSPTNLTSDLLHEVEHAVQAADGKAFAGGNFRKILRADPEYNKLGGADGKRALENARLDIINKYDGKDASKKESVRNFLKTFPKIPNPRKFIDTVRALPKITKTDRTAHAGVFRYMKDVDEFMDNQFPEIDYEYTSQIIDTLSFIRDSSPKRIKSILSDIEDKKIMDLKKFDDVEKRAVLKYLRDPGEVTARNVQFRFLTSKKDPSITRVAPRLTEDRYAGLGEQPYDITEKPPTKSAEQLSKEAAEKGVSLTDEGYYLASKAEQTGGDAAQSLGKQTSEAFEEFATPLKTTGRGDTKKFVAKEKPILRVEKSVEESLSPRMKRAIDAEKFPEAASILPAPGRFFDPARRDYKEGMAKGLAKAGIELDLEFGNYIMMGKGKPTDVSNETFENLFISPRTSFKRSQGTNTSTARANQFAENLSIEDMKKNYKQNTGKEGKEINTNLLQPERFKVIFNNEERLLDHPIIAVQPKSGKHYYTLDTQFVGPVNMKRMTDKVQRKLKSGKIKEEVPQPNLRPATVGDVRLGNVVGEIKVGSKTHSLYDYIEVDAVPSFSKGKSSIEKFNKGGAVPMNNMAKQMELFDEGGLMDEGGTIDPVAGNDVPPGSTQEEVRDDIPAQLSEGEFVFPADVVRFIGLEKLMKIRQRAKAGLRMMEEMGQMGNSEEAIMPDDLPFSIDDLDMEDDGLEMAQGGVVSMANGGNVIPGSNLIGGPITNPSLTPMPGGGPGGPIGSFNPQAPTGMNPLGTALAPMQAASSLSLPPPTSGIDPNLGGTAFTPTTVQPVQQTFQQAVGAGVPGVDFEYVEYVNESGQIVRLRRNKVTGEMLDPIPEGFTEKTDATQTQTTTGTGVDTAKVVGEGFGDGDEGPTDPTIAFGGTPATGERAGLVDGAFKGQFSIINAPGVGFFDGLNMARTTLGRLPGAAASKFTGGRFGQPLELQPGQRALIKDIIVPGTQRGFGQGRKLALDLVLTSDVYNKHIKGTNVSDRKAIEKVAEFIDKYGDNIVGAEDGRVVVNDALVSIVEQVKEAEKVGNVNASGRFINQFEVNTRQSTGQGFFKDPEAAATKARQDAAKVAREAEVGRLPGEGNQYDDSGDGGDNVSDTDGLGSGVGTGADPGAAALGDDA